MPLAPEKSLVETCWRYVMLLSIPKNEGNRTVRRVSDEIMMFPCVPQTNHGPSKHFFLNRLYIPFRLTSSQLSSMNKFEPYSNDKLVVFWPQIKPKISSWCLSSERFDSAWQVRYIHVDLPGSCFEGLSMFEPLQQYRINNHIHVAFMR